MRLSMLTAAVAALSLAACASSSGPVPIGPDTYMLAKPGSFVTISGGTVKAELYQEAGAFCTRQGKNLMPVTTNSRDASVAQYASAEITFRCLANGDPELRRPTIEAAPDMRIEMRNK